MHTASALGYLQTEKNSSLIPNPYTHKTPCKCYPVEGLNNQINILGVNRYHPKALTGVVASGLIFVVHMGKANTSGRKEETSSNSVRCNERRSQHSS